MDTVANMPVDILENREAWHATFKEGWLKHYHETGETNWDIYNKPVNKTLPTGKAVDLAQSRLVLITSAGSFLKDKQERFDDENDLGDYSTRRYPTDAPFETLAYAHTHYDHSAVDADPQVLVPLKHLANLVDEGVIGELAPEVISFSGYQPDCVQVVDQTAAEIVTACKEMQVNAALLVPS